jgi:hypothetical protein
MNGQGQALLSYLLQTSRRKEDLLRFIPAHVAEEVQSISIDQGSLPSLQLSVQHWADSIHYTWFVEPIRTFPIRVQELFVHALTPLQREGVRKILSLPETSTELSPFVRSFLLYLWKKKLESPDLLAEGLLPRSPLNCLLLLSRKQLLQLVNFLGLYDLADDMRQVVDKNLLRKLHHSLSSEQLHFLQYCSKQPVKWRSPKLGLANWDGSQKQLDHLLHYRGLIRLAKALIQEEKSFIWHVLHRFDVGRAEIVQKEISRKQDLSLVPYFRNQALHIAKRYSA